MHVGPNHILPFHIDEPRGRSRYNCVAPHAPGATARPVFQALTSFKIRFARYLFGCITSANASLAARAQSMDVFVGVTGDALVWWLLFVTANVVGGHEPRAQRGAFAGLEPANQRFASSIVGPWDGGERRIANICSYMARFP